MEVLKRKIIIVGAGHVGSHAGYALLSQGLVEEIVYIDIDQKKAEAQALDLYDSTLYLRKGAIVRAGDYSDAKDAQLLIVAAGPLPDMSKGQTRMDTLRQTIEVLLDWPPEKVFSTSTPLDSARLRRAIAQAVGVDQKSVYAYALGEHGESQMVPWSIVTIAGKPLSQLMEERPDTYGKLDLDALAAEGKKGGWIILGGKGSTEFGIGASIAEVIRAVFGDENRILPVSVYLDGQYGQHGVYASVPAVLNRNGVADIIELKLTEEEQQEFDASCKTMLENFNLALTL